MRPTSLELTLIKVFGRNIILRDLFRANFALVGIGRVFYAAHHLSLEVLPFLG
ncbi:MAG: hypothetical protein WBC04_11735 [Candidatus Acidiferrales bacterium]